MPKYKKMSTTVKSPKKAAGTTPFELFKGTIQQWEQIPAQDLLDLSNESRRLNGMVGKRTISTYILFSCWYREILKRQSSDGKAPKNAGKLISAEWARLKDQKNDFVLDIMDVVATERELNPAPKKVKEEVNWLDKKVAGEFIRFKSAVSGEIKARLQEEGKTVKGTDLAKEAGILWKKASAAEKNKYKREYEKDLEAWKEAREAEGLPEKLEKKPKDTRAYGFGKFVNYKIKKSYPDASTQELYHIAADEWRKLSIKKIEHYNNLAAKDNDKKASKSATTSPRSRSTSPTLKNNLVKPVSAANSPNRAPPKRDTLKSSPPQKVSPIRTSGRRIVEETDDAPVQRQSRRNIKDDAPTRRRGERL